MKFWLVKPLHLTDVTDVVVTCDDHDAIDVYSCVLMHTPRSAVVPISAARAHELICECTSPAPCSDFVSYHATRCDICDIYN